MAKLKDIIAYFCKYYPHKAELSKSRVTKMVYLADWKSVLEHQRQMTDIQWVYNYDGPYVPDVAQVADSDPVFDLESTVSIIGSSKGVISLKDDNYQPNLTNDEKNILDHIIKVTKDKYWNEFISLVYSTYPIFVSEKYDHLDKTLA